MACSQLCNLINPINALRAKYLKQPLWLLDFKTSFLSGPSLGTRLLKGLSEHSTSRISSHFKALGTNKTSLVWTSRKNMLHHLPRELLAQVLGYDGISFLVVRLWKTGDKILQSKLALSVTHVRLAADPESTHPYPTVLSKLNNLRSLFVRCAEWPISREVRMSTEISKLSSTLEELRIVMPDVPNAVLNFAPDWTSSIPKYITKEYRLGQSRWIDLGQHFPRLHTLELNNNSLLRASSMFDAKQVLDFAALPPTLTCLRTSQIELDRRQSRLFSLLPRGLLRLESRLSAATAPSDCAAVPPNLNFIEDYIPPWGEGFAWMPTTLTGNFGRLSWSLKLARTLPPSLSSLKIDWIEHDTFVEADSHWTAYWPPKLESLTLQLLSENDATNDLAAQLVSFPQSLTRLSWGPSPGSWASFVETASDQLSWPPLLHTLWIKDCIIQPEDIHLLPKTLKSLSFALQTGMVSEPITLDASLLPPALTYLTVDCMVARANLIIKDYLPSTLTQLSIDFGTLGSHGLVESSLQGLHRLDSLTDLKVSSADYSQDFMPTLPAKLTSLWISTWKSSWLQVLPRSLYILEIPCLLCDDLDVHHELDFFHGLSPRLTSLVIHKVENPVSTVYIKPLLIKDFPTLPNLTTLKIPGERFTFTSSVIRTLPKGLRIMTFPFERIDEEDAPFIPTGLRYIHLGTVISQTPLPLYLADHWPLLTPTYLIPRMDADFRRAVIERRAISRDY